MCFKGINLFSLVWLWGIVNNGSGERDRCTFGGNDPIRDTFMERDILGN